MTRASVFAAFLSVFVTVPAVAQNGGTVSLEARIAELEQQLAALKLLLAKPPPFDCVTTGEIPKSDRLMLARSLRDHLVKARPSVDRLQVDFADFSLWNADESDSRYVSATARYSAIVRTGRRETFSLLAAFPLEKQPIESRIAPILIAHVPPIRDVDIDVRPNELMAAMKLAAKKLGFSVAAEPEEPSADQDYTIVISIRLPDAINEYPVDDLSGKLVCTDGFELEIPFGRFRGKYGTMIEIDGKTVTVRRGDSIPVVDGVARLLVRVPGATNLVRDHIELRSELLGKQAVLDIEFGKKKSREK
jgi:hypothetical protein